MKNLKNLSLAGLLLFSCLIQSCSVIEGIFKAGVWVGIVIVVVIVIILVMIFSKKS